jgi:hypothetical protein
MTTLVAALASVAGAARAQRLLARGASRSGAAAAGGQAAGAYLAAAVLLATLLVDARGAGAPAAFASLSKPYFARDAGLNRRALSLVPEDASVAAQDHFVPHLALREHAFLLEDAHRAEWVIANLGDGTWPYRREEVIALLRTLLADGYRPVFSEGTAVVLRRGADRPVPLAPELARLLR